MNSRDDFSQKVKDILCERVGGKCSNPDCRHETKGPHSDSKKRVSIGQAAHITAASKGGPRYNPNMTSEQRRDIENGIWLCDSCAKMIDIDESQYPVELLKMWKSMAEYEQYRTINQKANSLETNCGFENRKNVACRKTKEALDNLHNTLQYGYEYCNLLQFVYQSDNCGLYNNYWRCFFEMLSENINSLINRKRTIDTLLYQRYSA